MLRRSEYEALVYSLTARFPEIRLSTLVVAPTAYSMAHVTGMIAFGEDIVLCIHELVDFRQGCILSYRYEVTRSIPPFVEKALPSYSS